MAKNIIRIIPITLLLWLSLTAQAATTVVWEGSKTFSSWADVLNISGSKFSQVKADDVVMLCLTATGDAQLQLSYGSSWTNFDGLESLPVKGDYSMVVTARTAPQLRQGIHVKGIGYTLKSISILSVDADYSTLSADLFDWADLFTSGADRGLRSTVSLQAYGGAGWYWSEPVDLSGYGSIQIQLQQPASESVIVQILYDEQGVKSTLIAKGSSTGRLALNALHKQVYSFNLMSEKAQTVAIASINLMDKQGNAVSSGVDIANAPNYPPLQQYYNLAGQNLGTMRPGINIIKTTQGGRTMVWKVFR